MIKNKCIKKSNTCLHIQPSSCTSYEGELNEKSLLDTCDTNLEETTEELYKQVGDISKEIDLEEIDIKCLNVEDKKANTIIKALLDKVCSLQEEVTKLKEEGVSPCNIKINTAECPIDLGDLEDECGERITTLNQLLIQLVRNLSTT